MKRRRVFHVKQEYVNRREREDREGSGRNTFESFAFFASFAVNSFVHCPFASGSEDVQPC